MGRERGLRIQGTKKLTFIMKQEPPILLCNPAHSDPIEIDFLLIFDFMRRRMMHDA